jgi:hypothetical protein
MKLADRVEFNATGTSAAVITVGAATLGMRTPAQAIASGEFSATETNVPFVVKDAAGNWESARYTLSNGGATLTQTVRLNSSNGGAAVTFNGSTLTVTNAETAADLNAGLINPYDPGFDIILLLGQSNMVGQDVSTATLDVVDPRVFTYGGFSNEATTYRKITQAVDPLRHNLNPASYANLPAQGGGVGLGPGSWLARTYAGMIPSNRKVFLVPFARSATKLFADTREWFPGDGSAGSGVTLGAAGSTLLDASINQGALAVAEAQLLYPKSRVVGIAWLQGEGDADWYGLNLQLNYQGALKTLIQAIRTRVPTASKAWFVIGGLMGENVADTAGHPGYAAVDNAHRAVAAEFPGCAYTPGLTGYKMGDNLHYTAAGARILGCNMASVIPAAIASAGVDTTAPVTRSATVYASATSIVSVALSEPYDPAYPPQASAWTVSGHTVTSASGNGNYVHLTVSSPFVNGEATRTVAYTAPGGGNGLRDLAGNLMATQSPINITNNAPVVDSTPPTLSNATVASGTPATLTMTASESLDTTNVPAASTFAVSGHTVTSVAVGPNTVTLSLGEAFVAGEAARTVSYTQPGSAGIRDLAGNLLVSFSGVGVTNNAPASDTTAPTFSSAQVANASPTVVQITMSESLAASNPPTSAFVITEGGVAKTVSSVSVSGPIVSVTVATPFSSGTAIQATYTAPGADPRIKDASGNVTASFGAVTVTNNVAAAPSATDLQFADFYLMTDTSVGGAGVAPYTYKMGSSVNYAATQQGGTAVKSLAGDGTFTVKLVTVSARQFIGLKTTAPTTNYGSLTALFMAETTGYKLYFPDANSTTYVTNRIPAENDLVRMTRSGTNVTYAVSSDGGTTWTDIAKQANVAAGTKYLQILGQSNGQFVGPVGTGFA